MLLEHTPTDVLVGQEAFQSGRLRKAVIFPGPSEELVSTAGTSLVTVELAVSGGPTWLGPLASQEPHFALVPCLQSHPAFYQCVSSEIQGHSWPAVAKGSGCAQG